MTGIYSVINIINNKIYIGESLCIEYRWNEHRNMSAERPALYLYEAIKEYGIENFEFNILEECSKEELKQRERHWIEKLDTMYPNGYNGSNGGEGIKGHRICKDSIKKRTRKLIGRTPKRKSFVGSNNPFYGKHHTSETKLEISKRTKGNKNPMYGKKGTLSPHYGKKHINNGIVNMTVNQQDLDTYLNEGWILGRRRKK